MIELALAKSYKRAFKKLTKKNSLLKKAIKERVEIFIENPFDSRLDTHKLKGKLKELWSFSIDYDIRIVFRFLENQNKVIFEDIGGHGEVY